MPRARPSSPTCAWLSWSSCSSRVQPRRAQPTTVTGTLSPRGASHMASSRCPRHQEPWRSTWPSSSSSGASTAPSAAHARRSVRCTQQRVSHAPTAIHGSACWSAALDAPLATREQGAPPLCVDELVRAVNTLQDSARDVRDRALLLLGFAGGYRLSDLVMLDVEHVRIAEGALHVFLPRSKEDQVGRGRTTTIPAATNPALCPVRALQSWLDRAAHRNGPLFRVINGTQIRALRMHPRGDTGSTTGNPTCGPRARLLVAFAARRPRHLRRRARSFTALDPAARRLDRCAQHVEVHQSKPRRRAQCRRGDALKEICMTQALRTPASTPNSESEQPSNTRERIERARALVIAQFGTAVLVAAENSDQVQRSV